MLDYILWNNPIGTQKMLAKFTKFKTKNTTTIENKAKTYKFTANVWFISNSCEMKMDSNSLCSEEFNFGFGLCNLWVYGKSTNAQPNGLFARLFFILYFRIVVPLQFIVTICAILQHGTCFAAPHKIHTHKKKKPPNQPSHDDDISQLYENVRVVFLSLYFLSSLYCIIGRH